MRHTACAVTGHRPSRFKFKYSEDYSLCKKIKRAMLEQFKRLYDEQGVRQYYVGGALGVDMWAGELILRLKEQPGYGDIELVVVLPFEGTTPNGMSGANTGWPFFCGCVPTV